MAASEDAREELVRRVGCAVSRLAQRISEDHGRLPAASLFMEAIRPELREFTVTKKEPRYYVRIPNAFCAEVRDRQNDLKVAEFWFSGHAEKFCALLNSEDSHE